MMLIIHTRLTAPSFKSMAMAGLNRPRRGHKPTHRVIVAYDSNNQAWVHSHVFDLANFEKASALRQKIDAAHVINPAHWRKAEKGEY